LDELYPYFRFLRYELWGDQKFFNNMIGKPIKKEELKDQVCEIVKQILNPIMIRREKKEVMKHTDLGLKEKEEQHVFVEMTSAERDLYEVIHKKGQQEIQAIL
jgi:SNF2 family DNA or RNA helicase